MPCPHSLIGNPKQCSQCIGATPKVIGRDDDGRITEDGRPLDRPFALGPEEHLVAHYRRGAKASARAKRKL